MNIVHRLSLLLLPLFAALPACAAEDANKAGADHAVVLVYHHVSEETPPSTSVTPEQFAAHLDYLAREGFTVWPLSRILEHLEDGRKLPERTVALTFDDAYRSVYTQALPMLRSRNFPFTIFVTTDYIDGKSRLYLSWEQLREMTSQGAEIGNHSLSHPHLVRRRDGENEAQWRARVRAEIEGAQRRLREELDPVPLFAYPYGEYTVEVKNIVKSLKLYGIAQQSGAVSQHSDFLAVPRFPMAANYAVIDRFARSVRTRALPVTVLAPQEQILAGDQGHPEPLRLRLGEGPFALDQLACYASVGGRLEIEWINRAAREFEVRSPKPLGPGRTKFNCTAPHSGGSGTYYWYSHLWMKKRPDGSWYRE
ncbi:polysaccharide deacetylase family protein [Litorivivens sp.]|uniref:polysaccharide deacetylase family protein n=1 Tax=Litorivivens sp. TaxID=2020868 RepID=UPI003567C521